MSWKKWQIPAVLLLGASLGFGAASYRSLMPELFALAGDTGEPKKKESGGIFSPPGTFEGGTVVPSPNPPAFNGKIGRTISESTPDWPPLARAPKGAPNVLYIVLDRELFSQPQQQWSHRRIQSWFALDLVASIRHDQL